MAPASKVLPAGDRKAVRRAVSGLTKLLYPNGQVTKEELGELVGFALEGRRRVNEQELVAAVLDGAPCKPL